MTGKVRIKNFVSDQSHKKNLVGTCRLEETFFFFLSFLRFQFDI